jgi:hypothetical protein
MSPIEIFTNVSKESKQSIAFWIDLVFKKRYSLQQSMDILSTTRDLLSTEEEKKFFDFYFNYKLDLEALKEIENENYSNR